jgi:hypothetical protein
MSIYCIPCIEIEVIDIAAGTDRLYCDYCLFMIEIQSASVSDHLFLHIRNIAFFKTNARVNNLGGKKSSKRIHPRSIENVVFSVERIKQGGFRARPPVV